MCPHIGGVCCGGSGFCCPSGFQCQMGGLGASCVKQMGVVTQPNYNPAAFVKSAMSGNCRSGCRSVPKIHPNPCQPNDMSCTTTPFVRPFLSGGGRQTTVMRRPDGTVVTTVMKMAGPRGQDSTENDDSSSGSDSDSDSGSRGAGGGGRDRSEQSGGRSDDRPGSGSKGSESRPRSGGGSEEKSKPSTDDRKSGGSKGIPSPEQGKAKKMSTSFESL